MPLAQGQKSRLLPGDGPLRTSPRMDDQPLSLAEGIRIKLSETLGPVGYEDLAPHLARDAVFVVAPALSLLSCGVAVALDDVDQVGGWISRGELRKPSKAEREGWARQPERRWVSVVVQPFVLVQEPPPPADRREAPARPSLPRAARRGAQRLEKIHQRGAA